MNGIFRHLLLLQALLHAPVFGINADTDKNVDATNDPSGWTWNKILQSREPIVSNGNIWPPPPNESSLDCLILVTRNQLMWHCPSGNETTYERTMLHRGNPARYRGAFMGLGSDERRMWILDSPLLPDTDELLELDTMTGKILQKVVIRDSIDGHDAVIVGNKVFIVDTRHGDIIEVAVPASSPPYTESSIQAGAEKAEDEGYANIIKRHTGFTRADHVNNVAIHPHLLISNLHGKGAIKRDVSNGVSSATRLSALDRSIPEEEGRELNLEQDGFTSVQNVGTWCHGIAFWEDSGDQENSQSQIKLISLDSKSGTMVSVVLSGPNPGTREVLWAPDENHPVLVPPDGVAQAYNNGAKIFSKGIAVQGGVAYFGVSYARAPRLRQTVPESLLVAVDLKSKKELWVRTVRSNGIINQILTRSYIGDVQLPTEMSSIEITHHGGGGVLVDVCEDIVEDLGGDDSEVMCKLAYNDPSVCQDRNARTLCCACRGGGKRFKSPHMAGSLDKEVMKIEEHVNATVTFVEHHQCLDKNGLTKRLPLEMKSRSNIATITSIDKDLDNIVKHLCNVNVEPIRELVLGLGDAGFTHEYQYENNNAVFREPLSTQKFKPGCNSIYFVFSSKKGDKSYHFPWLNEWLPILQEQILQPLGIPVNQILRMQLASMPESSDIKFHMDKNVWVQYSHRVHIPIITHPDVFFLAEVKNQRTEGNEILRIKSNAGEVYEFNNAKGHAVRNIGPNRVHLIIDWVEKALYNEQENDMDALTKLSPRTVCIMQKGSTDFQCNGDEQGEEEL